MHHSHQPIAQALLHAKLANANTLEKLSEKALAFEQHFIVCLLNELPLSAKQIAHACSQLYQLHFKSDLTHDTGKLPSFAAPYKAIVLSETENQITLGIADPQYYLDQAIWRLSLEKEIEFCFIDFDQLVQTTNQLLSQHIYQQPECAPTLAKQLLEDAIHQKASDIHCEPQDNTLRIRFRIDGLLHTLLITEKKHYPTLCSHLKVIAQLDIAEKRLPQDGRFRFLTDSGFSKDCRISTCPGLFGEKIVIRILHAEKKLLQLNQLGLSEPDQEKFLTQIKKPHGLILVTGPTGSGKTVTLYTALHKLNQESKNIATVEDPVEIYLEGIHQVNIQPKAGLDFAKILRAFLRQDPDILMVGEIRDSETANIAIRAAHTGHLVLATLHTNSAVESITRLMNMDISPHQLSSSLNFIVAQRLVRKKCPYCQTGCDHCHKGYKGRTGIFECLALNDALREAITQQSSPQKIQSLAIAAGMRTLEEDAQIKLKKNITSKEEIQRVLL